MARKPNYNFEKLRKERDRKAKKDAKRADRQRRKQEDVPPAPEPDAASNSAST